MQQPSRAADFVALPGADIPAIRAALLAFYDASARALPWRETRDPYAVWISEVMSQQTRVETVIPYYERWLERFPSVDALADADGDDVLKAWEGLGYYSRARNLHAAARVVRERHGGTLPDSCAGLRTLPGVGEYTAGAVASIAFGARCAAVDGNVRRVLARLLDHPAPPTPLLNEVADALVPADRPGDFNQALMELGATICTPRTPRCARCPVAAHCAARAAGTQQDRPLPKVRKAVPTYDIATAVVRAPDGRLLITRRPPHGLLAGMWCFPGDGPVTNSDRASVALHVARSFTTVAAAPRPLGVIEHVFSHRRERYHCYAFDAAAAGLSASDAAWIGASDTTRPLPRGQQRIRALALAAFEQT